MQRMLAKGKIVAGPLSAQSKPLANPERVAEMGGTMKISTVLGRLRLVGLLEGISFLVLLFIAMPLKYAAGQPEMVRIVGMAHGVLFLAYVWAIVQAHAEYAWGVRTSAFLFLASLLPFGPFIADRRLLQPVEKRTPQA